jgi:predicted metal-binding protein
MGTPLGYLDVCVDCTWKPAAGEGQTLGARLAGSLKQTLAGSCHADTIELRELPCLGLCKERCRASLTGPGRWAWVIGDLWPDDDHTDLMLFLSRWLEAPSGLVPKTDRPASLRKRLLARVPPLP